jgi:hypothetical protein
MMKDVIEILKATGEKLPNVRSGVQGNKIMIMSPGKLVIDVGDLVRRKLSTGAEETYRVTNPEFSEGLHGIPPHYTLHVTKLGLPEATKAIQSITYNISGHNTRINNNSVDQSTNVYQGNDLSQHISQLRAAVSTANISDREACDANEVIDEVETQLKSGQPKRTIVSALLKALPPITSVMNAATALMNAMGISA